MKKAFIYPALLLLTSCGLGRKEQNSVQFPKKEPDPLLKEDGRYIVFPENSAKVALFRTEQAAFRKLTIQLSAPANVIGRVHLSEGTTKNKLILFDSPDLTNIYSSYLQNVTLLKSARQNFERVKDLYSNGAATGKEFNDASSEMLNIETALSSGEAMLRESGLHPENLNNARLGTIWLICDLPESELNTIKKGQKYNLLFPSFPNEHFVANIDAIADVMNSQSRKIRIRLSMIDTENKIRPGMYAQVNFEMPHEGLMVPKKAVFSTNARYYVFIRKDHLQFERREVVISSETGDYIEISGGLSAGEQVVYTNVYLLKGIDMGI